MIVYIYWRRVFVIREKSCGAIIFRKTPSKNSYEYLIIEQCHGHWGFPKGHVEENESEHETAYREILEETGVEVKFIDGFRESTDYSPYPNCQKEVIFFLAEYFTGIEKPQESEILSLKWAQANEVMKKLMFKSDECIFDKAVTFIQNNL